MGWWSRRTSALVAAGYQPAPRGPIAVEWVVTPPADAARLVVFCPTVTVDGNAHPQAEAIGQFAAHLTRGLEAGALPPCVLVVGAHHAPDRRREAVARLEALARRLAGTPVAFAAFCTVEPGKVAALNVAIDLALRSRAIGLLQIDDDIRLAPRAIEELYAAYEAAGRSVAVGASKVAVTRSGTTSKLMQWSKRRTRTAVSYPHACCMLLDPALLAPGIPSRYVSDDGYICFRLLRPDHGDPLALLRLVPAARCFHHVGGPPRQALRRVHGILLSVHVFLADFPPPVSRCYVRKILFPGFRPLGVGPASAPLDWLVQAAYFLWFVAVGAELAIRGALHRPLRDIGWAPVAERDLPADVGAST